MLSGEPTLYFSLVPLFHLKGSRFFPVRLDPNLEGYCCPGRKQEVTKVVPLHKHGHAENFLLQVIYF